MPTPTLRYTAGSILRAVLIVGAWLIGITVLWRATTAVVWFAEAVVIASLAYPVVAAAGRHMPRPLVIVALTLVALATVALLSVAVFEDMQSEANELRDRAQAAARTIESSGQFGSLATRLNLAHNVQELADGVSDRFQIDSGDLSGIARELGGNASAVLAVWILSIMLVATGPAMVDSAYSVFRADTATRLRWVLTHAYRRSCRYIGLMSARSLAAGLVGYVVARALGLEVPVVLAVWLAIWTFVPYVGLVVGGLPFALLAALNSPAQMSAVLAGILVVQVLDAWLLQQRIDCSSLRFGVFLSLSSALIGFSLYGGGGLVVAVLIAQFATSILVDIGTLNDEDTDDVRELVAQPGT